MPGLKPNEWQEWNTENLSKQETVAEENVNILLNKLWELGLDRRHHDKFKNRLAKWKVAPSAFIQKASTKMIFELQRDLVALEHFISIRGVVSINVIDFTDINGIYKQIQTLLTAEVGPTGIQPAFPYMVEDANLAILTDGNEPPAEDMQKAQEYFAERAAQSMQSTEL